MTDYYSNLRKDKVSANLHLVILLLSATLLAVFVTIRYGGLWGDNDTHSFATSIAAIGDTGQLIPDVGSRYPNGYGFQVTAVVLGKLSGISVSALQTLSSAILAVWLIFPVWLLYRELTGEKRAATLATIFLLVQPEFLFTIMRGSHEKFSRGLMLLSLYLLLRSIRTRNQSSSFSTTVMAFYISTYAMITLNNYLSISFLITVALALLLIFLITRLKSAVRDVLKVPLQRLAYALISSVLLGFLFIFYIYPPALHTLSIMESVWEQLALLLLDVEATATSQAYQAINLGWVSLPVYAVVSLANWLLLFASGLIWAWMTWSWYRSSTQDYRLNETVLWALYTAFALLGGLSVLVDVSGTIIGNLQHRTFPSFAMIAAPLVAWWVDEHIPERGKRRHLSLAALGSLLALLAIFSTFKATNEPMLSNKWTFYLDSEVRAVEWANKSLSERGIWVGYDERIASGYGIRRAETHALDVQLDIYQADLETRDYLVSSVIRSRSARINALLPIELDSATTYDNGQTQVYHLRPRTPFQK